MHIYFSFKFFFKLNKKLGDVGAIDWGAIVLGGQLSGGYCPGSYCPAPDTPSFLLNVSPTRLSTISVLFNQTYYMM